MITYKVKLFNKETNEEKEATIQASNADAAIATAKRLYPDSSYNVNNMIKTKDRILLEVNLDNNVIIITAPEVILVFEVDDVSDIETWDEPVRAYFELMTESEDFIEYCGSCHCEINERLRICFNHLIMYKLFNCLAKNKEEEKELLGLLE